MPLALGTFTAAASAGDGYAHAPFRDEPIAVMQAATLEALALPGGAAAIEGAEAVYGASLEAKDPDLARRLRAALATGTLPRELAERALEALAPRTDATAFEAAVAARLLLSEAGLVEGYEALIEGEESEGGDGHGFVRAALGRVASTVTALASRLAPAPRSDAEELLGRLASLLPEDPAQRPAAPPETIESLAQGLVVLLERASDADLYIDRDLATALATVRRIAREGCVSADPALGGEALAIAARYHEEALASPLSLLAPEAGAEAEAAYAALADGPGRAACPRLLAALDEATRTLSGERAP